MIPLPTDTSMQDIEQWCSRGVVMVVMPHLMDSRPEMAWVPAFYRCVSPARVVEVQLFDGTGLLAPYTTVAVHWPRCGSVNLPGKGYAVHAARITARQYRRTWHAGGVKVTTPRSWEIACREGANFQTITLSPSDLAKACFLPQYPTIDEAEDRLTRGDAITVALTPSVIMAGDSEGKRMFYHHGELVATGYDRALYSVGRNAPLQRIIKLMGDRYHVACHF